MSGRKTFARSKSIIFSLVFLFKVIPKFLRIFIWDLIRSYSQVIFVGLRFIILKSLIKDCGDNVKIGTNVTLLSWENLRLGSNVSIHANCYIDASGEIEIGNDVSVAHNCSILSTNHDWVDKSLPIKYNPISFGKVVIDDDVWIGCGSRILAGVQISKRTIIAAGAVVNKDCSAGAIYGGVPAKLIKSL